MLPGDALSQGQISYWHVLRDLLFFTISNGTGDSGSGKIREDSHGFQAKTKGFRSYPLDDPS